MIGATRGHPLGRTSFIERKYRVGPQATTMQLKNKIKIWYVSYSAANTSVFICNCSVFFFIYKTRVKIFQDLTEIKYPMNQNMLLLK